MPGLVLTGDLTDYLGEYLPTPFIDKVDVYQDSLKVKASIYLRAPDIDTDPTDLLNSLDPLKIYISMVIGKQQIQDLINGEKDPFWSIVDMARGFPQFPGIDCCDAKCKGSLMKEYQKLWDENSYTFVSFRDVDLGFSTGNLDRHAMDAILWHGGPTTSPVELPFSHTIELHQLTLVDTLLDENSNKIFKYSTVDSNGASTIEFNFPYDLEDLFGDTPLDYTPATGLDFESAYGTTDSNISTTRDTSLENQYPLGRLCKDYQDLAIFAWTSPYAATDETATATPYRYDGSSNEPTHVGSGGGGGFGHIMTGYQYHKNFDQSLGAFRSQAVNQGWDIRFLPDGGGASWNMTNITPNNEALSNVGSSKLVYTKVIEGSEVASGTQVIYVDSGNLPYSDAVLQSLNGKYYKAIKVTPTAIITNFEALVAEYAGASLTPRMQELLDNISYILGVYGQSVELLIQLNSLRMVIPEQGNATIMGKLFNKITTRIANFDSSLGRENILFKRLGANHTVYERRSVDVYGTGAWSITDYGWIGETWESYVESQLSYIRADLGIRQSMAAGAIEDAYTEFATIGIDQDYLYSGFMDSTWLGNAANWSDGWADPAPIPGPIVNFGYVFFDFEKYLYERTKLSQVLDISKLEQWFGKAFVNMAVVPYSLARERYMLYHDPKEFPDATDSTEDWEEWIEGEWAGGEDLHPASMGGAIAYFLKYAWSPNADEYPEGYGYQTDEYNYADDQYPMQTFPVSVGTYGKEVMSADSWTWISAADATTIPVTEVSGDPYSFIYDTEGNPLFDTSTRYTYIAPHSFNVASSAGIGDYRLMSFEWQDVISNSPQSYQLYEPLHQTNMASTASDAGAFFYKTTLKVFDRSEILVDELVGTYADALAALSEYLALAGELCSYNNITNEFNQFFINGVKEHYGDDLTNAPWNRVPVIYLIHRDLLENTFNGSVDDVISAARRLSAQIGPDYGSLEAVQDFQYEVNAFYEQNYGNWDGAGGTADWHQPKTADETAEADTAYGGSFRYHVKSVWPGIDSSNNTARDFGTINTLTTYKMVDASLHLASLLADDDDDDGDEGLSELTYSEDASNFGTTVEDLAYFGVYADLSVDQGGIIQVGTYLDFRGWMQLLSAEKHELVDLMSQLLG